MSTKVARWGGRSRRIPEMETGRTVPINPATLWRQRAGGPIRIPRAPTERPAKPSIIGFLIYELLIQVTLGAAHDRDTHPVFTTFK